MVNHALGTTVTANDTETNYWGADKAVDGIVNRDEANKQNQSRWSTNGARTFDQVAQKDKVLTVDLGSEKSFDQLVLEWERCNATQYEIQYKATNEGEWTTAKAFTQAPAQHRDVIVLDKPIQATQLRVYITESDAGAEMNPGQTWDNVSIYEFEVYAQTLDQGEDPSQPGDNAKPVVIPELAEWTGGTGDFTITNDTRLVVNPQYKTHLQNAFT